MHSIMSAAWLFRGHSVDCRVTKGREASVPLEESVLETLPVPARHAAVEPSPEWDTVQAVAQQL